MKLNQMMGLALAAMIFVAGCKKDPIIPDETFTFDFEVSTDGWVGGFADYPDGEEVFYELSSGHDTVPSVAVVNHEGLRISGSNHSDDLFMFFKKQIEGLESLTEYEVTFELEIASQYPENSVGIGGSPGSSVYVKAGATVIEPLAEKNGVDLLMNIDKGNQASEGADMINLGTVGIEGDDFVYTIIERDNLDRPFSVTTDSEGKVWLIVGTDSGFEGVSTLFYDKIEAKFSVKE